MPKIVNQGSTTVEFTAEEYRVMLKAGNRAYLDDRLTGAEDVVWRTIRGALDPDEIYAAY